MNTTQLKKDIELLKELKKILKVADRTKSYGYALMSRVKELENEIKKQNK